MERSDDDDIPDSMTPEQRRERGHFERHRLAFMVGFLPIVFGMFLGRSRLAGAILFALAGLSWIISGASAFAAKRHMFSGVSGGGMFVRVRPSERTPVVATIVGVILVVLGLGLFNVAAQLLLATL